MKKAIMITLGLTIMLCACNTFEGVGEDIKKGGEVISDTASDTKKKM